MSRHVNADARRRLLLKSLEAYNRPNDPELRKREYEEFKRAFAESIEIATVRQLIEKGVDE